MEGYKTYRHKSNPKEKELHDKFIQTYRYLDMERIIFPEEGRSSPDHILSERDMKIMITTVQWLGSSVGQGFLKKNGFELKKD